MKINKNLKYALVLSGGGARGLVHIGVLEALEMEGYPRPALVAGTSMGAIVGGLYASGMGAAELKRFVVDELDLSDFMESPAFRLNGPIGKIFQTGQAIGNLASKPGIDSGSKVLALLEKLSGGKNFEDCPIPFLCNAVDIASGRELIFRSGSLAKAIRASMSFPAFFEPLVDGDLCLVDGGLADNMPSGAAREAGKALGIRRVLAVDTRKWRVLKPESFKSGIQVVMRCFDTMIQSASRPRADLTIRAVDKSSTFDFNRKKELIALGEAAIRQSGPVLRAFFGRGFRAALGRHRGDTCGLELDDYFSFGGSKPAGEGHA